MSVLNSNPFLIASGSPNDPAFPLQRSVRLRDSASAYFNRTPASAGSRTTWTWSGWVKRGAFYTTNSGPTIFSAGPDANNFTDFRFLSNTSDVLDFYYGVSASTVASVRTAQVFRDPSSWYHIVIAFDTTQATAANRIRIYVNGVQVTAFTGTPTYPAQNNAQCQINATNVHYIGRSVEPTYRYMDGYITEVNFVDGQALTPSSFGGYNAGTNVWEVRKYSGTYGTNGFYLPFTLDTTSTYAGSFNGTAKYISAPNNAVFAQQSATNWTVEGWVYSNSATLQQLFVYGNSTISTGNDVAFGLAYTPGSTATLFQYNGTTNTFVTSTLNVPLGQWCHIAAVNNGGTVTIYINGVACGTCAAVNTNSSGTFTFYVGNYGSSRYINGQVSNFRLVKGTAVYTSNFVPTTTPLTAITNTALLTLQNATIVDNSTNAFTLTNTGSLTTIAATPYVANVTSDASGNKNNWIPNNINASVSGATYDSMLDVPTNTSANNANFPTLNPLFGSSGTLGNANLSLTASAANPQRVGTIAVSSGKWYYEVTLTSLPAGSDPIAGFTDINNTSAVSQYVGQASSSYAIYTISTNSFLSKVNNATFTNTNTSVAAQGNILSVALDLDNNKIWFAKNGTWVDSGDPAAGTNSQFTVTAGTYVPAFRGSGGGVSCTIDANFGQRPFSYTPPTGFKALNTYNLPEPTIPRGDKYFKQYLYTGNGGGQQIGEIQKPASLFNLDRSLRFRSANSAYLSRTWGTPTNGQKFTCSFWLKRGALGSITGLYYQLFGGGTAAANAGGLQFTPADVLNFYWENGTNCNLFTTNVYKDPSLWYHIVIVQDTTQATPANRVQIYVNNVLQTLTGTYPAVNATASFTSATVPFGIMAGKTTVYSLFTDGYLADFYWVDGQAVAPTSFGAYDGNNYWTPKAYTGTYGTNGFHLEFEDYSNNTATTIGKDTSGQGNNWTPTGISITAGPTYDSMTDVPTLTSETTSNFATMSPLIGTTNLSSGNLYLTGAGAYRGGYGNIPLPNSGKWYWEGLYVQANNNLGFGLAVIDTQTPLTPLTGAGAIGFNNAGQWWVESGSTTSTGNPGWTATTVVGMRYDASTGEFSYTSNGSTWTTIVTGTARFIGKAWVPAAWCFATNDQITLNFGQRPFQYTPPTGFKSLNSFNVAEVTGDVETPDLVRIKSRSATTPALWFNSVSGAGKYLTGNNSTAAEATDPNSLIQFNKNGLLIGNNANINTSAATYIADVWKAGDTIVTNTAGSITSQVRANPISGVSIVSYTGTNANATVGHGLGVAPKMIIIKPRTPTSTSDNWEVYHVSAGNGQFLTLNSTAAAVTASNRWNNTSPTSTVFSIGTVPSSSADDYIAYCFSEIAGFSKFDSYISNGSATDGPFVYTGFRPRWVMIKQRDATRSWIMYDTTRNTYNVVDKYFFMEGLNNNEQTAALLDINSNGFKLKNNNLNTNTTAGSVYIYMAFAENPFKYALAR